MYVIHVNASCIKYMFGCTWGWPIHGGRITSCGLNLGLEEMDQVHCHFLDEQSWVARLQV